MRIEKTQVQEVWTLVVAENAACAEDVPVVQVKVLESGQGKMIAVDIATGIYTDMPNDVYRKAPGISKTGLDLIAKCPAMYNAYVTGQIPFKVTPTLSVGKATHLAVFEPERFAIEVAVAPNADKRSKAGKEEHSAFEATAAGKTIITATEYEQVMRVAESVRQHPIAGNILKSGQPETSIFTTDEKTGERVKVRPDWIHEELLVDLKTSLSADPDYFSRDMYERRYFVQAPLYLDYANQEYAGRFKNFLFIVAEKQPPDLVEVYLVDQESMQLGRNAYRKDLDTYHHCKTTGKWPCYTGGKIKEIGLPGWAIRSLEN